MHFSVDLWLGFQSWVVLSACPLRWELGLTGLALDGSLAWEKR